MMYDVVYKFIESEVSVLEGQSFFTAARCPALSSPSARPLTMTAPFFANSPPISAAAFRPYSVGLRLPPLPPRASSPFMKGSNSVSRMAGVAIRSQNENFCF